MRSILVALTMLVFLLGFFPVFLITLLIGVFSRRAKVVISQSIVSGAFHVVLFLAGTKRTVVGLENIPKDEPVLFIGNHRSYADIPIFYTSCRKLTGFLAKKEISRVPFLSWWMYNLSCLFLDRKDLRKGMKTILKAVDNVKAGYSCYIMPEGTRNHGAQMLPFKEGSFKVAEKSGCPIIPVAITNADDIYENHIPWIRKTHVVIHFGTPIPVREMSREELKGIGAKVREIIAEMLCEDQARI